MVKRLRAEQVFIDELLIPKWQPSGAVGYDPNASEGADAFVPIGTSLDETGEYYPHVTVQRTNETAPGESSYNFLTTNGPGQTRTGQLLVTARAEDRESDYTGDSATYSAVPADELVDEFISEAERVAFDNPEAGSTDLAYVGGFRGADAPDDFDEPNTVRIEQTVIPYSWLRTP